MNVIQFNADLEKMIGKIDGDKKLIDSNGIVKGVIITPMMRRILVSILDSEYSQEELEKMQIDPNASTTEEALAWLEKNVPGFPGGA